MSKFKVSGAWLNACGYTTERQIFEVLDIDHADADRGKPGYVTLDFYGRRWIVDARRGSFVEESALANDAQAVADLIVAGKPKQAEALYQELCAGLALWEGLVLQDRIFSLAGPVWPERASI